MTERKRVDSESNRKLVWARNKNEVRTTQVCCPGTVAQIIAPSSRRKCSSCTRKVADLVVFELQVFQLVLYTSERVQQSGVKFARKNVRRRYWVLRIDMTVVG